MQNWDECAGHVDEVPCVHDQTLSLAAMTRPLPLHFILQN
jgi:hypothetical protein